GGHEHVLDGDPDRLGGNRRHPARVREPLLARTGIRVAAVRHDGARLAALQVLAADEDRRRLHAGGGEHRGRARGPVGDDERHVTPRALDARRHPGRPEPPRRGHRVWDLSQCGYLVHGSKGSFTPEARRTRRKALSEPAKATLLFISVYSSVLSVPPG